MTGITVGQKIYVRVRRIRRLPELVEATVTQVQGRYITCNYFGKDYRFYRINGKQVTSSSQPDEIIEDMEKFNRELEREELNKKTDRHFQSLLRGGRSKVTANIKKLNIDEVKALMYLLKKLS